MDTGPWIFGKKVVLSPRGIDRIDRDDATVFVHRTKDEIKDSPEYDDTRFDEAYRNDLGTYYGPGGRGVPGALGPVVQLRIVLSTRPPGAASRRPGGGSCRR